MRRQTRQLILNLAAGTAIAATALVVFTPASFAAPGTLTENVNVRQGPGRDFPVVGRITAGTTVDVRECENRWCFVNQPGPNDGYVSADFIRSGGSSNQIPGFGIQVGPGGVQVQLDPGRGDGGRDGGGRRGRDEEEEEEIVASEVCFFERTRYRGESFCAEEGDSIRRLGDWADRISSIENEDGLEVRVCRNNDFRSCRTFEDSVSSLGNFDDDISSIQVR